MLLRVTDLRAAYAGGADVLAGVTFELAPGEHLGISGDSGAGKSTLLRIIAGLAARERAFSQHGSVELATGTRVGLVTEDPISGLHPQRTVAQTWRALGIPNEAAALLRELEVANAEQLLRRYPHQLSGGEAQRVRLAMALAGDPGLLLLESPTAPLDAVATATVLRVIERRRSEGTAIVHVTHDRALLARVASRHLHLRSGKLVAPPALTRISTRADEYEAVEPLLRVEGLCVRAARAARPLVTDVGFELHSGEALGLTGRSGSGKTSLGLALARLVPANGRVAFRRSAKPYPLATAEYANPDARVQYLWQEPRRALNPALTVRETLRGLGDATVLCTRVGLPAAILERRAVTLSTGEMLRLTLARVLAVRPEVLICDEVFAGVNARLREELATVLYRECRDRGLAVLWIGHDLRELVRLCDRTLVLAEGHLVDEIRRSDPAGDWRHPATRQLLDAAGLA